MLATRRSLVVPVAALALFSAAAPSFGADGAGGTGTITAAVGTGGTLGSRSVTTVVPGTLTTSLNSAIATGSLVVTVTEAARTGTASWSVTAAAGDLTDASSNVLAATNLSVSGRSVTATAGTGGPTAPTGSSALSSAATLFTNGGQSTSSVYTGLYTSNSTMNLAIPNGTAVGTYSGTLTVSLI